MAIRIPVARPITAFRKKHWFLSNFYPVRILDPATGLAFGSVEHAYQAWKTDDRRWKLKILRAATAAEAKAIGSSDMPRTPHARMAPHQLAAMEGFLLQKFRKVEFRDRLVETYPLPIRHDNYWHDNFWGNCRCLVCVEVEGKDHQGRLLMKIRDMVRPR